MRILTEEEMLTGRFASRLTSRQTPSDPLRLELEDSTLVFAFSRSSLMTWFFRPLIFADDDLDRDTKTPLCFNFIHIVY
mgnify:CR=1 FL=1